MRINNINLRTGWAEFKPPHPGDRQVRKCPREGMSFVIKPPILSRPPPPHGVYIDMCIKCASCSAIVHAKTTTTHVNPFDAQNNDTIKPIRQKLLICPLYVVEPIEAKTSYKLVYTCVCQKLAEHISRFSQAQVSFYTILYSNVMLHYIPLLLRMANDMLLEENIYAHL